MGAAQGRIRFEARAALLLFAVALPCSTALSWPPDWANRAASRKEALSRSPSRVLQASSNSSSMTAVTSTALMVSCPMPRCSILVRRSCAVAFISTSPGAEATNSSSNPAPPVELPSVAAGLPSRR